MLQAIPAYRDRHPHLRKKQQVPCLVSLRIADELDTICGPGQFGGHRAVVRHNSTPRDGRAALCQAPALLHLGLRLMLHKNPETESVRDQQ